MLINSLFRASDRWPKAVMFVCSCNFTGVSKQRTGDEKFVNNRRHQQTGCSSGFSFRFEMWSQSNSARPAFRRPSIHTESLILNLNISRLYVTKQFQMICVCRNLWPGRRCRCTSFQPGSLCLTIQPSQYHTLLCIFNEKWWRKEAQNRSSRSAAPAQYNGLWDQ